MEVGVEALALQLKKEKYQLVGGHSAVKKCRWLHESLRRGRVCYKEKFYGIRSHRCLQMTPTAYQCTMQCLFCWRVHPSDIGAKDGNLEAPLKTEDPSSIVEECLEAQRRILTGYKALSPPSRYFEAQNPRHAAISLTGEPALYERLGELVGEFHRRGMTTFLVTSGTAPKTLSHLTQEPTQLYLSAYAPEEGLFRKVCRPKIEGAWRCFNESLESLGSFKCPTTLRLTLVRHLNMADPEGYARLVERASPTYVEAKGYVYVGMSRRRLEFENMPSHNEIKAFAQKLAELTGYNLVGEAEESRVVLLSTLERPMKVA